MAQYRRDVFNLAKGPGMAISDPREDEARAKEASRRADQALGLQRLEQAQRSYQVQRSMDLQQEAMQTEAALAAQRSQSFAQEIASRMNPGQQAPLMGRDAIMRQAHTAKAAQDALTGAPEARGRAANMAPDLGGPRTFATGAGYGSNGQVQGGGVMQAAFDRASGLFGDLSDVNTQVAGRNLVAGEQRQAFEIQDALAKTGLLKQKTNFEIEDARTGRKLEAQRNLDNRSEADRRLSLMAEELGLKRDAMGYERADRQYALDQAEKERRRALATQALETIQGDENLAGIFTHGKVGEKARGKLAAIGAVNPELAQVMAEIMQNPEAIRRVRESADSIFRHRTVDDMFFGLDSDMTQRDAKEREYQRTISRLGPGAARPGPGAEDPRRVEAQAAEILRAVMEQTGNRDMEDPAQVEARAAEVLRAVMEDVQKGPADSFRNTRGPKTTAWWDPAKEDAYQEWSRRPSSPFAQLLRQEYQNRSTGRKR